MLPKLDLSSLDAKRFRIMLKPSWLSAFCCLFLSLTIVAIVVGSYLFDGSWAQQLIDEWRASLAKDALMQGADKTDPVTGLVYGVNTVLNFVLWAFVGVFFYAVAAGFASSALYVKRLKRELNYQNVDRKEMLRFVRLRVVVRCVTLFLWLAFTIFFLKKIFFFCLLNARLGAESGLNPSGVALVLLSLSVLSVCLHLHVVFLRALLLRPRTLTSMPSV